MKKVTNKAALQGLAANYVLGFQHAQEKGKKGASSTYADDIGYEGERDSIESGRAAMKYADRDSVEARFLSRLRAAQVESTFLKLPMAQQMSGLMQEAERAISELEDDGDFRPYSEAYKRQNGIEDSEHLQTSEALQRAAEAEQAAGLAQRKALAEQEAHQTLKRSEAQQRHDNETLRIENQRLKEALAKNETESA